MKRRKSKPVSELTKEEWDDLIKLCWLKIEQSDDPFHWSYWFWIEYYNKLFGKTEKSCD